MRDYSTAFGYSRISKEKPGVPIEQSLSLEAQRLACEKYWEENLKAKGVHWGGMYGDERAESAKTPLLMRAAGIALSSTMQGGDHVIMPKLDRAWRNLNDAVTTMSGWEERGITIHFISEQIVLGGTSQFQQIVTKMLLVFIAGFAELDRNRIRERTRDALAVARSRGRVPGVKKRTLTSKEHPTVVAADRLLLWLVDVRGLSAVEACKVFTLYDIRGHRKQKLHTYRSRTSKLLPLLREKYTPSDELLRGRHHIIDFVEYVSDWQHKHKRLLYRNEFNKRLQEARTKDDQIIIGSSGSTVVADDGLSNVQ